VRCIRDHLGQVEILTQSVSFGVARLYRSYAEGVKQHSPGQSQATQSRGAALGEKNQHERSSARFSNQSSRCRDRNRPRSVSASAKWRSRGCRFARPMNAKTVTQGGVILATARNHLPWAMLFNAFGVKGSKRATNSVTWQPRPHSTGHRAGYLARTERVPRADEYRLLRLRRVRRSSGHT
jgi:hypothetical protein